MSRVLVVIPAYNEEPTVGDVVRQVLEAGPYDPLVVDDGSRDGTARAARAAGARVLSLPTNLGIGGAVQTGLRYARAMGYPVAVQVDADGQHDPAEIGRLVAALEAGGWDVAVGSRFLGRGDYRPPPMRAAGMAVFRRLVNWAVGQDIRDTTSGFRAFSRRAIELFAACYPVDYPEVEALVLAHRSGLRVTEVPVRMRPRQAGRSSITPLRSAFYMAKVSLAIAFHLLHRPPAALPGATSWSGGESGV